MDISVVIPLLNEEESLPELESWIRRVMEANNFSYEIIFVDDGSTDASWHIIKNLSDNNKNIKALRFRRNYGKSPALNEGFKIAEGDVVITMDADLQDSPDEIPELYDMIKNKGYDLVSGWKKVRYDSKFAKNIPSKFFNFTTRLMTGIKLHDFNCGLKAYRNDVIKNIEVYGEMHRYIPILTKNAGFKHIGEKVVEHHERKYGHSKFGIERMVKGYLDLISITFMSHFGRSPMYLFGSLGTLMFLAGFIAVAWIIIEKFTIGAPLTNQPLFYLAMLAIVLGVQLFLAGFLGEMINRRSADRNKYLIDKTL